MNRLRLRWLLSTQKTYELRSEVESLCGFTVGCRWLTNLFLDKPIFLLISSNRTWQNSKFSHISFTWNEIHAWKSHKHQNVSIVGGAPQPRSLNSKVRSAIMGCYWWTTASLQFFVRFYHGIVFKVKTVFALQLCDFFWVRRTVDLKISKKDWLISKKIG